MIKLIIALVLFESLQKVVDLQKQVFVSIGATLLLSCKFNSEHCNFSRNTIFYIFYLFGHSVIEVDDVLSKK